MWTDNDIKFMREALRLAKSAQGKTSPDPMVGAVIVKNQTIIASGYHAEQATPHAEAWAIKKAGKKARGGTLYVNLEPCCFFEAKNNPPCTKIIIESGIKKVITSMQDPNPCVNGKGIQALISAGIEVKTGLLEDEAKKLNEIFLKNITTGYPFVIIKAAMSLDGKIATKTGESKWITGEKARQKGAELRNIVDAVMVGIGTVLKDDPQLTVRNIRNKIKDPQKIILDPQCKITLKNKVLRINPKATIVIASKKASKNKIRKVTSTGAKVLIADTDKNGKFNMNKLMRNLGSMGITSILIEGGGKTHAAALSSGIVDKAYFFIAPKIIGGKNAITPVEGKGISLLLKAIRVKGLKTEQLGNDILLSGYILK